MSFCILSRHYPDIVKITQIIVRQSEAATPPIPSGRYRYPIARVPPEAAHQSVLGILRDATPVRCVAPRYGGQGGGCGGARLLRNTVLRAPRLSRTPITPPAPSLYTALAAYRACGLIEMAARGADDVPAYRVRARP
ncbi:hypothetical protein C8F04DRAFT_1395566 [Mycena alexandri]|uniref:Uncharacterized protein n=1 Tax=Mycena alexandri TaxID=1745969 RepID=A0AAD6X0H9_9AGAR|nr:hypothetical protein C8F04DRAFT_1395566 [Mycena alexandri]